MFVYQLSQILPNYLGLFFPKKKLNSDTSESICASHKVTVIWKLYSSVHVKQLYRSPLVCTVTFS